MDKLLQRTIEELASDVAKFDRDAALKIRLESRKCRVPKALARALADPSSKLSEAIPESALAQTDGGRSYLDILNLLRGTRASSGDICSSSGRSEAPPEFLEALKSAPLLMGVAKDMEQHLKVEDFTNSTGLVGIERKLKTYLEENDIDQQAMQIELMEVFTSLIKPGEHGAPDLTQLLGQIQKAAPLL
jgi:hypothetical protein